jgi:phage terminase small subunit
MHKEPQVIKVNTEEDFKITLREGTKISIPKNAFVNAKTGRQVSGEIDVHITEFYKLSDMLLADLSTKSNDKILETGGMLFVVARQDGSELKLKPQKEMEIVFNNSGKPNMQLFTGEKDDGNQINWVLNESEVTTEEVAVIESLTGRIENTVMSFQSVDEAPIFPGCENNNNKERKECMSAAIVELVNRKFDTSIAADLRLTGKQRIMTSFEIDKEGNIGKIEVRASYKSLAEEALRVIELLPQLIPGKQKGKPVVVKYVCPIVYSVLGDETDSRVIKEQDSVVFIMKSDKGFIKRIEEKPVALINNSDIDRYTLATTNLGWINCDRFVRSKKRKIKYKVKIKDSEGANVKMIFKSISSVLPSKIINNEYSFGDIPIDEDVILLAIKKKGDKLFLGMKNVKTKLVSELDLEFKEVTTAELKSELYELNKGFN